MLIRPDDLGDFIRNALHTHLRQLVVCRDFGRIDHVPFFPLVLLLDASIEEERDMCVLFSLYVQHVEGERAMSTLTRERKA
jgi:hypothetical protein